MIGDRHLLLPPWDSLPRMSDISTPNGDLFSPLMESLVDSRNPMDPIWLINTLTYVLCSFSFYVIRFHHSYFSDLKIFDFYDQIPDFPTWIGCTCPLKSTVVALLSHYHHLLYTNRSSFCPTSYFCRCSWLLSVTQCTTPEILIDITVWQTS